MPDAIFDHPRLAAIYDALEGDRSDLAAYVDIVTDVGAHQVLDIGCGTGTFAVMLADLGLSVIGVDPAQASLDVARAKPGAERVRWIHGNASSVPRVPPMQVDLVTMTANVAQAIADPADWAATLRAAHRLLRPGGQLVFETRDPARRAWTEWDAAAVEVLTRPDVGMVRSWVELVEVSGPLVSFRWSFAFERDGALLTSESTLRFRERDEVASDLRAAGFELDRVGDAPDRPGRELVFFAHRPS